MSGPKSTDDSAASVQRVVARNIRIYGVANVAGRVLSACAIIVVARSLSRADFGRYTVAVALASLLTRFVELGLGGYLARQATQDPDSAGRVLGHVLVLRAALGVLALGACATVAALLGYDAVTFAATLLIASSYVITISGYSFVAVLVALERAREIGAFQTVQALALGIGTVAAALAGAGPVGLGAVALVVAVGTLPVSYALLLRHWHGLRFEREGLGRTLSAGAAYSGQKIGSIALTYLDSVLVQALRGNVAAGMYGASYRLLLVSLVVPITYSDAVTRSLAHLAKDASSELQSVYSRVTSHLIFLGLPMAVGGALLAAPIVTTVFGDRYAPASTAAVWLLLSARLPVPEPPDGERRARAWTRAGGRRDVRGDRVSSTWRPTCTPSPPGASRARARSCSPPPSASASARRSSCAQLVCASSASRVWARRSSQPRRWPRWWCRSARPSSRFRSRSEPGSTSSS